MQRPDGHWTIIADLNEVVALRIVLKELFTVHSVVGTVSAMRIA